MSRQGIQLCYPFEERRLETWHRPFIIQPKLDGIRCRAVADRCKWTLYSSEMNIITSVPHIQRALRLSELCPVNGLELDGELYVHGWPIERVNSVVSRTKELHPEFTKIQFHVFDMVSGEQQIKRMLTLDSLSCLFPPELVRVPFKLAEDLDSVMDLFNLYITQGYEGIIVRHLLAPYERKRSRFVMKFKPKKDDYYKIVGVNQMVDKNGVLRPAVGSLTCMGDDGEEFSVGSGMTDEFRFGNWDSRFNLIGRYAHVKYQHITTARSVPRFPIFIEIVDHDPKDLSHINPLLGDFV